MAILIIEDDVQIRNNMVEILEIDGYETIATDNGVDGVTIATTQHPDVILCDLSIPRMNGYEVLEIIRQTESTQTIPFVVVTARTDKETINKVMDLGATDMLLKPFTASDFLTLMASFH